MRNFKGKITCMSKYTSKLTIVHYFIFSIIHMPPRPIASAGCDTSIIFLCKKSTFQIKIYTKNSSMLLHFF